MTTTTNPAPVSAGGITTPYGHDRAHLLRIRSAVRAVLVLGLAASVAGNVLHAQPTLVGRAISAWSPLALLLTVELISRVPVTSRRLAALRMLSTAVIAGIAAWVSYWHMVSVAAAHGESATSAHLLPLSVDGLVVVASISLVEIATRLRHIDTTATSAPAPVMTGAQTTEPAPEGQAAGDSPDPLTSMNTSTPTAPVKAPARRTPSVPTSVKVARLRAKHPDWTVAEIAARVGVTERTARRHLNTAATASTTAEPVGEDVAA